MPPAVVFFDQIEAIAPVRGADVGSGTTDRVVGQLLTELDELSLSDRVLVIGATNRPDMIDSSILRAGRLGLHVEIPLPNADERRAQLVLFCREAGVTIKTDDVDWVVEQTSSYSGADLRTLAGLVELQWSEDEPPANRNMRSAVTGAMRNIKKIGG
jgi:transitional endoplasmic reticulum ATPase